MFVCLQTPGNVVTKLDRIHCSGHCLENGWLLNRTMGTIKPLFGDKQTPKLLENRS